MAVSRTHHYTVEPSDLDGEGKIRLASEIVDRLLPSLPGPERPSAVATSPLDSSLEKKV